MRKYIKETSPGLASVLRYLLACLNSLLKFACFVLFFPVLFVLYCIEPFKRIRFYHLGCLDHFGWQVMFPDRVLRTWQLHPLPAGTVAIILAHSPENETHFQMVKRAANVWDGKLINRFADYIYTYLKQTRFFVYDHEGPHNPALYPSLENPNRKVHPPLSFTPEEMERGHNELARMGIGKNDWFVCFHNRDRAHYDWDDHQNIRNCKIDSFMPAAQYITQKGGFAIRVGATVEQSLPDTGNPKIIDYASNFRSDFMDMFLFAHTKFFLGSLSGIYMGVSAFDRPVVITNHIDLSNRAPQAYNTFIPKLIRDTETGRILNFSESVELSFECQSAEDLVWFSTSKYEYVENSEEEILEACKDMLEWLGGKEASQEAFELQNIFNEKFVTGKYKKYIKGFSGIAPSFLLRHKNLIEN